MGRAFGVTEEDGAASALGDLGGDAFAEGDDGLVVLGAGYPQGNDFPSGAARKLAGDADTAVAQPAADAEDRSARHVGQVGETGGGEAAAHEEVFASARSDDLGVEATELGPEGGRIDGAERLGAEVAHGVTTAGRTNREEEFVEAESPVSSGWNEVARRLP
ncbi:MAG: hypothetical protein IPN07_16985 [Dehalococcoidia bacterium]|nr:hypothetical protein [Dehalococcoidia bacterium]